MGSRYFAGSRSMAACSSGQCSAVAGSCDHGPDSCARLKRSCCLRRASSLRIRRAARALHPEQPASHRISIADRPGLPRQHQKRGLECVFRLVPISQGLSADPQNHGTVPLDQKLESGLPVLALTGHKSFQKLAIGQAAQDSSGEQTPELDEIRPEAGRVAMTSILPPRRFFSL